MDPRARRLIRQHLKTDQLLGVTSVPVAGSPAGVESGPVSTERVGDKTHLLEVIEVDEVRPCTKCPLHDSRKQTVFGEGNPNADLMIIGEGPGQKEDLQGRPFVGPAGEMLNKQIAAMGLSREQVYIANVVKCRPPNNRAPLTPEIDACWDYLLRQIRIIEPKVIMALGGPAAKTLLQTKKGITALRGTWHTFDGLLPDGPSIPVMPSFHPAYLLRAYTPENRRKVWSDLQQVMKLLGLSTP